MNPQEYFSQMNEQFGWMQELPGMTWRFNEEEVHVFVMEINRRALYRDSTFRNAEEFAATFGAGDLLGVENSSGVATTTTSELYAFLEGFLPAARAHLDALVPEDPEAWRRVLSDPLLLIEMLRDNGVPEEDIDKRLPEAEADAERRLADAEAGIVRLPCGHTRDQHQQTFIAWFDRNVVPAQFWMATLHRLWRMPPKERTSPGKPFLARYDMELQIEERMRQQRMLRFSEDEQGNIDFLVLERGMTIEEASDVMRRSAENGLREAEQALREQYEKTYRIID